MTAVAPVPNQPAGAARPHAARRLALLAAAQNIDTAAIAAACANPAQIAAAIDAARLAQITPLQNAYRRQHTESH